ncbi:MAG: hypothetical protein AAF316_04465 [Cyanobacteria bacterium P01_A01_bin.80]
MLKCRTGANVAPDGCCFRGWAFYSAIASSRRKGNNCVATLFRRVI